MTDLSTFSAWLTSATRSAIFVVRARVYRAREQYPELRSEANAILKRITQELAARGEAGLAPMLLLTDLSDVAPYTKHAPYQSGSGDYGAADTRQVLAGVRGS